MYFGGRYHTTVVVGQRWLVCCFFEDALLEEAMGKETAERLMIGCLVHYSRSYQRIAERVSSSLSLEIRNISKNTFCKIAQKIPSLECKSEVMKVFGVLRGEIPLHHVASIYQLSEEAFVHGDTLKAKWMQAWHWCEWWMRLPHLKMLCQAFIGDQERAGAPRDTNGVERVNQASKDSSTPGLLKAMENLYKKDKVVALSYMAAERNITITYRSQTEEARRESASSRKR